MLEDKIDAFCQKAIDTAEKEAIIIALNHSLDLIIGHIVFYFVLSLH